MSREKHFTARRFNLVLIMFGLVFSASCDSPNRNQGATSLNKYAKEPANLKVHLTDAPLDSVQNVFVDVSHIDLMLADSEKKARVSIAEGLGAVDLLKYQNGALLPADEVKIPGKVELQQIRLVLNSDGNYLVHNNGDICQLKTPSAQQSGLKIVLEKPVEVKTNKTYSAVIDFDAQKSIVIRGQNNGCLLKPVLKLVSLTMTERENLDGGQSSEEELVDGSGSSQDSENFDVDDPSTYDEVEEEELDQYF